MSLRQIINFPEAENTAVGINLLLGKASGTEYSFCVLKKEKDELQVLTMGAQVSPHHVHEQVTPYLAKGVRVQFNIEGKGILLRETIDKVVGLKDVIMHFPGIEKKEFLPQVCSGAAKSFLSIFRREVLVRNELYALVKNNVSTISIGPFILCALKPLVSSNEIYYNGQKLSFKDESLERVEPSGSEEEPNVNVGSLQVKGEALLAFASAVNVFLPTTHVHTEQLIEAEDFVKEFIIKKRTFRFGRALLAGLLFVLLVNTVLFFQLRSVVSAMQEEVSGYEQIYQQDEDRQSKASSIEKAFGSTGWISNDDPLMFADQLGASVPVQIELSKLEIGVLDEGLYRKEKRHQFLPKVLKVQGYADNPAALANWIAALEKLAWADHIENQNYQHDSKKRKGLFEFIVHIK
jgi:hypothetical protein